MLWGGRIVDRRRKRDLVVIQVINNIHRCEDCISQKIISADSNTKDTISICVVRIKDKLAYWNVDSNSVEGKIDSLGRLTFGT
jgi:hypothetical protein